MPELAAPTLHLLERLAARAGATWTLLSDSRLEVQICGLSFEAATYEDVFILGEVFESEVYAIAHPAPCIVLDVGANIGISALFFASKPWVSHVYGFEPLKPTAAIARANLERNPRWRQKVTLIEYGLGARDEAIAVQYSPEWKGNVGRHGIPARLPKTVSGWTELIVVRDASAAIRRIVDSAPAGPVVMKMDCEGAEWDILPNLAESGVLSRIDQLVFEWHHRTPEALERLLLCRGFSVVRRTTPGPEPLGLTYATQARRH